MFQTEVFPRNIKLFLLISGLALVGGYLYVAFLATGYRAYIYIHAGILFFAGMAIFLRNIKPFLIFSMLFALAFGFGRHIVYQKLEFESTLFSSGIRIDAVDVVLLMCYIHWGLTLAGEDRKSSPNNPGWKNWRGFFDLDWICFSGQPLDSH